MATFKTWTHPTTGEVRVYISGLAGQRSEKVWIQACEADSFGFEYTINAKIHEGSYANRGDLIDAAEAAIFQEAQARVKDFAAVVALSN
jgi:hypothetical protein